MNYVNKTLFGLLLLVAATQSVCAMDEQQTPEENSSSSSSYWSYIPSTSTIIGTVTSAPGAIVSATGQLVNTTEEYAIDFMNNRPRFYAAGTAAVAAVALYTHRETVQNSLQLVIDKASAMLSGKTEAQDAPAAPEDKIDDVSNVVAPT